MQLAHPYRLELEYQQQMMAPLVFLPEPVRILQLGLGAAALTKFCHRHLRTSSTVVVEIDPAVVRICRLSFALPPDDERLQVVEADAAAVVRTVRAAADWLQVDLYDAAARGPVLDDAPFYAACRDALRPGGVAAFNLFGSRLAPSLSALGTAFGCRWLRLPRSSAGNTVVLAFAPGSQSWHSGLLRRRALAFERRFAMPFLDWLEGARTAAGRRLPTAVDVHWQPG
jgi:spermidine synthase